MKLNLKIYAITLLIFFMVLLASVAFILDKYERKIEQLEGELTEAQTKLAQEEYISAEKQMKIDELISELDEIKSNVKSEPHFNPNNLLEPSNMTPEDAENMLRKGLKGIGESFILAEEKYGVNARFMIAVAREESGNGTYRFMSRNNLFSLGAYDSNVDNAFHFDTVEECIMYFAKLLKEDYLTEGGRYYNGVSVYDVNVNYAKSDKWAENIINIAR